jgi:hypothetical protein
MEKPYNLQYKFKKDTNYKTNISSMQFQVVNLITRAITQNIHLGKNFSLEEKQSYIKLF